MTMRERGHTQADHAGSPHPRPDPTATPAFGGRTADEQRFVASYRRRARNPLPPLRSEDWTWHLRAHCRGMDPSTFFPIVDRGPGLIRMETKAKAICRSCPVIADCRHQALAAGERYGVWGGLTTTERALHEHHGSGRSSPRTGPHARPEPDSTT